MLNSQAEKIAQRVGHYLITHMGQSVDRASDEEFYRALCSVFRAEIMVNWVATTNALKKKGVRRLYYLSMEYMPGRLFGNNLTNINAIDLMKSVLSRFKRNFLQISQMEPDVGIGNGGLGRLASCFLDSLSTLQYPAMGYGMRYQYGIFEQELICGVQIERPDCWLLTQNPWELRRDHRAVSVCFGEGLSVHKNSHGDEVYDLIDSEEVRALPYDMPIIGYSKHSSRSVLTLRLWSTKETPRNFQLQRYNAGEIGQASENTSLTDVLYPNDNHEAGKRIRLKQEFLLASASLQDIINQYREVYSNFDSFGDVVRIQINDTHPALIIPELMHLLTKNWDTAWDRAWDIVCTCCSYTNHTILREALEEWNVQRFKNLLPCHFAIIQRLNKGFCRKIRKKFPNNAEKIKRMSIIEGGQIRMAHLAIYGSHRVNGVARLHTHILKSKLFKDFYAMYPEKFVNITNGVTQRRWLLHCNPLLSEFLTKRIGDGWITNFEELKHIAEYADDPASQEEFLNIKKQNKARLLSMMGRYVQSNHGFGKEFSDQNFFGVDALFDIHVKRIHEYKRQLMNALHLLMTYYEIKNDPNSHEIKRFAIFGGKAAPGYQKAKNIIRLIYCISRKINNDPDMQGHLKVFFLENYNVSHAEVLIPGADLSEQISTAGMEASGTGNMKFAINGALTVATDDGANVEMRESITNRWWPFVFGASAQENIEMHENHNYNPLDIYASDPKIKWAVNTLKNRFLAQNDAEHESLLSLYKHLLEGPPGIIADPFFILNDLTMYHETKRRAEGLYKRSSEWARTSIHNIAGTGRFSSDSAIENYVKEIWKLERTPIDMQMVKK